MVISAIFIEVFLVRLSLLRKSWESKFKYCAAASNYQLPNYGNSTIRFHDIYVRAHYSGAGENSGLRCTMSWRLLKIDVLQQQTVLDFFVPEAGDDKFHRNVGRYLVAYLRKFNKGKLKVDFAL
jgi:hypothetical protein